MKAEGDDAPYPGCVTPLAFGSLRAPTSVPFALHAVGEDGRRLRRSAPTYAYMKAESDGTRYPGCVASLGVAALASLRAPTSVPFSPHAVGEDGRRLRRSAPAFACMEVESDGTSYPGCVTPLAFGSLRARAYRPGLAFAARGP